jgi:hypothetical protein
VTDRLPRVLALVAEADGPALWRIFQPFAALTARCYPAADWDWKDNPLLGDLVAAGRYDAVILPRLSWNDADEAAAERWMAALHRAGMATIYEVDDDFFSPQFLRQQRQAGLEAARGKSDAELDAQRLARIRALQRCDGVTVSSHRLPTVYGSVIVDGESGALCRTVDEWTAALLRLVDDTRLRRQWARALRHRVEKHHTLDGNLWHWPAAWQTILDSFRKTHTRRLLAG